MHNVKGSQETFNDSLEQCDHQNKFIYPMSCLRRGIILSLYVMKECPSWLIQIYVISYSAEFLFEFMIKHLWRPIVKINPIWVGLSMTNIVSSFMQLLMFSVPWVSWKIYLYLCWLIIYSFMNRLLGRRVYYLSASILWRKRIDQITRKFFLNLSFYPVKWFKYKL